MRASAASPDNPEGSHNVLLGKNTGLGLLRNVVIDVHVSARHSEHDLGKLLAVRPGMRGLGVDESTAIVVHGDSGEVVGEGKAWIWDGQGRLVQEPKVLAAGMRFTLPGLTAP